MKLAEQQLGAVLVLKPEGPLTSAEAEDLKVRLMASVQSQLGRVVLDLSAVPFVDSRVLEALADVTDHVADAGQVLRLCAASKTVRQILELTGLAELFEHYDDANSAVRSFL